LTRKINEILDQKIWEISVLRHWHVLSDRSEWQPSSRHNAAHLRATDLGREPREGRAVKRRLHCSALRLLVGRPAAVILFHILLLMSDHLFRLVVADSIRLTDHPRSDHPGRSVLDRRRRSVSERLRGWRDDRFKYRKPISACRPRQARLEAAGRRTISSSNGRLERCPVIEVARHRPIRRINAFNAIPVYCTSYVNAATRLWKSPISISSLV